MYHEIPGLTPLWVIDFKSKDRSRSEPEKLKRQLAGCQDKSQDIFDDIAALQDAIDQFRKTLKPQDPDLHS